MLVVVYKCSRNYSSLWDRINGAYNDAPSMQIILCKLSYRGSVVLFSTIIPLLQSSIMRGIGAGTRIFDLLDRKPVIPIDTGIELSATRRGPVRFEGIRFEYPSRKGVDILKDFELEIGVGESVAIVYVVIPLLHSTS